MSKQRALFATVAFAATLAFAAPAAAQGLSGFYVGGTIGQAEAKDACEGLASCDDKDTAWRLLGGFQLGRIFGVELGYHDLGEVSAPGIGLESTVWELVGIARLPLANAFSLYGKAGAYRAKVEGTGGLSGLDETNNDLTFGVGVQFDISPSLGLRGEWQRYRDMGGDDVGGESDVDVLSIGLVFGF